MAETNSQDEPQPIEIEEEEKLKYLELVQVVALHGVVYASRLYGYARDNAGPLKAGVENVEGTVKTVVGPVYNQFHDVPCQLLKFVDRKVEQSVNNLDNHVPPFVKNFSTQALSAAQKAPTAARAMASEVKSATDAAKSAYIKYEPTAKELYSKYEPLAEQYAASAWRSLNKLPLFPRVAQAVVPTAAYYSDKYNQTVMQTAEKGYKVSSYLPLVPTEKIAKVFSAQEAAAHWPKLPIMMVYALYVSAYYMFCANKLPRNFRLSSGNIIVFIMLMWSHYCIKLDTYYVLCVLLEL